MVIRERMSDEKTSFTKVVISDMSETNPSLAETTSIDEEIVAYLDGELDAENEARVVRRLSDDPAYRLRLNQLQQAWELLDKLRGTEADDEFTASTVAMVAVQAEQEAKSQQVRTVQKQSLAWAALVAVVLLSVASGYSVLHRRLTRADRNLVRDLPVIEHVDEYSNIDNVSFLKALESENLFPSEVDDGT
jgi:anti-sigma factor RsiW